MAGSSSSGSPKLMPRGLTLSDLPVDSLDKCSEFFQIVVFGASGDLAARKIYPALFDLFETGLLGSCFYIVGYARTEKSLEDFHRHISRFLPKLEEGAVAESGTATAPATSGKKKETNHAAVRQEFLERCFYVHGQYDNSGDIESLKEFLDSHAPPDMPLNRLFYLSLPPNIFNVISELVGEILRSKRGWNRLVVEKPLGRDTDSSRELSACLAENFREEEIYRMDHYLGKEVVQNLLVLRFANLIFDPLWNRGYVNNVQIILKEELGVEGRGGYFDSYGIIRDVMQNHMMQVLALIAMEPPVSLQADDVRNEKLKVLKCIKPIKREDFVVGQYSSKKIGGVEHPGYRDDPTVASDSITPTFAATVLHVCNRRWDGVPFLLKCGKGLDEKLFEIRVQFSTVPGNLYSTFTNELIIRVQPDEGIHFKVTTKAPGIQANLRETPLNMQYKSRFNMHIPDAYVRLIYEALIGDQRNFIREDELDEAWKIFTPVLQDLEREQIEPDRYPFGSRGPVEAEYLAAKFKCKWAEGQ